MGIQLFKYYICIFFPISFELREVGNKNVNLWLQVHRRLQFDDGFGVEEPLDEMGVDRQGLIAKGKIFVTFDEITTAQRRMKHIANQV